MFRTEADKLVDFTIPELLAIAPAIILWAVRDNPDYQKVPYKCKWSINDLHAIVRPELRQAELREGNQGDGVVYLGFMHAEKDKGVMPIKIRNKHLFLDQKCEGSKAVYGKLSQTPVLDASQSNNRSLPGIQLCDKDGKVCSEDHIEVDPLELGGKKYAELCIRHDQVELQSARRINAYRLQNWASCRLLFFGKGLPFMHKPHPFYTPQLMIYDPHENPSSTEGRVVPTQALERGNQCLLSQLSQRAVRGGDGEDGKS